MTRGSSPASLGDIFQENQAPASPVWAILCVTHPGTGVAVRCEGHHARTQTSRITDMALRSLIVLWKIDETQACDEISAKPNPRICVVSADETEVMHSDHASNRS